MERLYPGQAGTPAAHYNKKAGTPKDSDLYHAKQNLLLYYRRYLFFRFGGVGGVALHAFQFLDNTGRLAGQFAKIK